MHVDISHNHLEQTEVEIIAEGLKENHTILGIHFAGNEGEVDTQGFVRPGKPLSLVQSSILSRIPMNDTIVIGSVKNSQALELSQN